MKFFFYHSLLALCVLICSTEIHAQTPCTPGSQRSCSLPGISPGCSTQTCNATGSGWGSCVISTSYSIGTGDSKLWLPLPCTNPCSKNSAGACASDGSCKAMFPLADGTSCDDGNICNGIETCRSGVCTAGIPDARIGTACTQPASRLKNCGTWQCTNNTIFCAATLATANVCGECNKPNPSNYGNPCSIGNGSCQSKGIYNICNKKDSSLPASCNAIPIPDGTKCDDGNACTSGETCQQGVCTGGNSICVNVSTLPGFSAASSRIFAVGNNPDDPSTENKTCTIPLSSLSTVDGVAVFYPDDFEKQFMVVSGEDTNGAAKLAILPPKSMGELGDQCNISIQYRSLPSSFKMIAAAQLNGAGQKDMIGIMDGKYCYYSDVDQLLKNNPPGSTLPAPTCPSATADNTRVWKAASNGSPERICNIDKIDSLKNFSKYIVAGIECSVQNPVANDPDKIVALDICDNKLPCSFVVLESLAEGTDLKSFWLKGADTSETKFYAGVNKDFFEISQNEIGGWSQSVQTLSDAPTTNIGQTRIILPLTGLEQEKQVDARFEPDDNAWNFYADEGCGLSGKKITPDASGNSKVVPMEKEYLTADSKQNNISNNATTRLCNPKFLLPFMRKNYGGPDLAAIFDIIDTSNPNDIKTTSPALSFFFNINEKPKLTMKGGTWDGRTGTITFEASDPTHDILKNSVKSFQDAQGNDISCWVDKIEHNQVSFTQRGACQPSAAAITLNVPSPSITVGQSLGTVKENGNESPGREPLSMVLCSSDPGNAYDCQTATVGKAVVAQGGQASLPGTVSQPAVTATGSGGGNSTEEPMGYKISGGCSLAQKTGEENFAAYAPLLLLLIAFVIRQTPFVDKTKKNVM